MSSAQLEQHITLASQGAEELTVVCDVANSTWTRSARRPGEALRRRSCWTRPTMLPCACKVTAPRSGRWAFTCGTPCSAQAESWLAVEAATVALDSLQQVREHLQRAQHVMREVAAGDSRSSAAATDAVQAAGQAAVHLRSGRSLTATVREMVGLTWAIGQGTNYMQEPEIWARNDHGLAGTSRHAAPATSARQAPVGPAR